MDVERDGPAPGATHEDALTSVDWSVGQALTLVALAIALLLGAGIILTLPPVEALARVAPEAVPGGALIGVYGILFGTVWLIARVRGSSLADAVGMRPVSATLALGTGIAFAFAARLFAIVWVVLVEAAGFELPGADRVDVTRLLPFTPVGIAITALLAAVVAPVVEEVLFRGILVSALQSRWGIGVAAFASAAVFAIVHFNLFTLGPIFVLGYWLARLYTRTRSLYPPIVAHAAFNAIALVGAYALRMNA